MSGVTRCDGLNNGPEDVHILIPRIYEYVTLHGKKDVIQLRIFFFFGRAARLAGS